jgi:hypothetical protein
LVSDFRGCKALSLEYWFRTFLHFQGSMYYLPLKHRELLTQGHSVISLKT